MATPRTPRAKTTPALPIEEAKVVTAAPVAPPLSDPIVVVPKAPSLWTSSTLTAFISGLIAFVLGLLTLAGAILPASVTPDVQVITGLVTALAGLVTPVVVFLTRAGVVKAGIAAGFTREDAVAYSRHF